MQRAVLVLLVVVLSATVASSATTLVINEVMSNPDPSAPLAQRFGFVDPDRNRFIVSDWIELYNSGEETVDLTGLYLTDDCILKTKWKIPPEAGLSVESNSYLVLWCPGYYRGSEVCPLDPTRICPRDIDPDKAPFRLSSLGEWVGLYEADGETLIDGMELPPMPFDQTVGRDPEDASKVGYLERPTIGADSVGRPNAPTINLGPIIDVRSYRGITEVDGREQLTVFVTPEQRVRILADVRDLDDPDPLDMDNNIRDVTLFWKVDSGVVRNAPMEHPEGCIEPCSTYQAEINPQPEGSVVEFYLVAVDKQDKESRAYVNPEAELGFQYPVVSRGEFATTLVLNEVLALNAGCPNYDEGEREDPVGPLCSTGGSDRGAAGDREQGDDWVELYNAGDTAVSLDDLYITNNELYPTKLPLALAAGFHLNVTEDGKLPAGKHMLIWCDNEPSQNDAVSFHAPFTLNGAEDEIFLVAYKDGGEPGNPELFIFVDYTSWGPREERTIGLHRGPQDPDWSLGRFPDGAEAWGRMEPSPGRGEGNHSSIHPGGTNTDLVPFLEVFSYEPVSPKIGEAVTFFARAWDDEPFPDGAVTLEYMGSASGTETMHDDGAGGDMIAGDGIYTAVVQNDQLEDKVLYHARAKDADNNEVRFPVKIVWRYAYFGDVEGPHPVISEVVAANRQCACSEPLLPGCELGGYDNFADAEDWIEVLNPTESAIDLGVYYLTDRLNWLTQWEFPDTVLLPGERIVVWCDGEVEEQSPDNPEIESALHAWFQLDAGSDEVMLVYDHDSGGFQVVDFMPFADQVPDISFGRDGETGEIGMLLEPTLPVDGTGGENARLAANVQGIAEMGDPSDPQPLEPGATVTLTGLALDQAKQVYLVSPLELIPETGEVDRWDWRNARAVDFALEDENLMVPLPGDLAGGFHRLCVLSGPNATASETWFDGGVPWTRVTFTVSGEPPVAPVELTQCELDGDGVAHLQWTNGAADYDGIRIFIDGSDQPAATLAGDTTSYDSAALGPGSHTIEVEPHIGERRAAAAMCAVGDGDEQFVRGDSNDDADVNIADAVYILQNLFANGPAIVCPDAADANDDEDVNIADPVYLLQWIFANGPVPPAPGPGPACGPDPEGDALGTCAYTSCP